MLTSHPDLGDTMYVFGGKDDDNNKLNDLWKFSFQSLEWQELKCPDAPAPRSGHSAQIYKNYIIIFGGIFEVTKELNDMYAYDIKAKKWHCLFEELNSPHKVVNPSSPGLTIGRGTTKKFGESPRKDMRASVSPNKAKNFGATATSPGKKKIKVNKVALTSALQEPDRKIVLESPTSNTMKNSFLIKNADPSFEKSYAQIKKRAQEKERLGQTGSGYDDSLTKTCGKRPPARDGHTGMVIGDCFFVFGGDRHHMPFNDFHMLDLKSEFQVNHHFEN